jgi:benzoyl-CoA reductase/2-hydroxyglutaryl-CoA dehydratase subunit BcrC/BadD/HgdB
MMEETALHPECYKRHAEIENHIKEGNGWRVTIIGIMITALLQVGTFIYFYGRLTYMVENDSKRLTYLEDMFPRSKGEKGGQGIQGIRGEAGRDGK